MLSKKEVMEYQHIQFKECLMCALKPKDTFCPYIWVMGDIKMGPCDEYVWKCEGVSDEDIAKGKERVYRMSEAYERAQIGKSKFRKIEL